MNKKRIVYFHLQVIQRGHVLLDEFLLPKKSKKLLFSEDLNGQLPLPFYHFNHDMSGFLSFDEKSQIKIKIDFPCQGLITSQGTIYHRLATSRSTEYFTLTKTDYMSLEYSDLTFLGRFEQKPQEKSIRKDSRYSLTLLELVASTAAERNSLIAGIVLAGFIISCVSLGFAYRKIDIPMSFENLRDNYTLPYIDAAIFETAPEALKFNLDRKYYTTSAINFYREFVILFMGWQIPTWKYLYPTAISTVQDAFEEQQEKREEYITTQESLRQQTGTNFKHISMPLIIGQSYPEKILYLLNGLSYFHQGLKKNLESRRQITDIFRNDISYNWEDYSGAESAANNAGLLELSKIKVFNQLNNEEEMYHQGLILGQKATLLRKVRDYYSKPHVLLSEKNIDPVYISPEKGLFLQDLPINDLSQLVFNEIHAAELYTEEQPQIREPEIGHISSNLLEDAIAKNQFQIRSCYEIQLRKDPDIRGTLSWSWSIDTRGLVYNLVITNANLQNRELIDCVRRTLASWRFPKPEKGSINVFHTFKFTPQKSGNQPG